MANYYAQAIKILSVPIRSKLMLFEIAKRHPKAIVEADIDLKCQNDKILDHCRCLCEFGEKNEAIKYLREKKKTTLIESKQIIDNLMLVVKTNFSKK